MVAPTIGYHVLILKTYLWAWCKWSQKIVRWHLHFSFRKYWGKNRENLLWWAMSPYSILISWCHTPIWIYHEFFYEDLLKSCGYVTWKDYLPLLHQHYLTRWSLGQVKMSMPVCCASKSDAPWIRFVRVLRANSLRSVVVTKYVRRPQECSSWRPGAARLSSLMMWETMYW